MIDFANISVEHWHQSNFIKVVYNSRTFMLHNIVLICSDRSKGNIGTHCVTGDMRYQCFSITYILNYADI